MRNASVESKVSVLYPYADKSVSIASRISWSSSMTAMVFCDFDINHFPNKRVAHAVLNAR
jgi:hypothetical protein